MLHSFRMARPQKSSRDVVTNAKRVFDEFLERSEQPPNRGVLKAVNTAGVKRKPSRDRGVLLKKPK